MQKIPNFAIVFQTQRIAWPREIRLDCIANCVTGNSRKTLTCLVN